MIAVAALQARPGPWPTLARRTPALQARPGPWPTLARRTPAPRARSAALPPAPRSVPQIGAVRCRRAAFFPGSVRKWALADGTADAILRPFGGVRRNRR